MKKDTGRTARRAQVRRILDISERIKKGDYPNCTQMAQEMDASHRTIARDVEFMRDELELPIEFDRNRNGYYYAHTDDKLLRTGIVAKDVEDLVEANHAISEYLNTPMEKLMREAFQQMKHDLGLGFIPAHIFNGLLSFRPFAPVKIDIKAIQTILTAAQRRRVLQFKYQPLGSDTEEEYTGFPYHISCINHCWTLFLCSLPDRKIKKFPIYRMRSPERGKRSFKIPKRFNPNDHMRGSLIWETGDEDHEVIVELDRRGTQIILHRYFPAITDIIELPDGCSRVHLNLSTLNEIEKWIFVMTIHATVLGPPELIERMKKTIHTLAKRYGVV